MSSKKVESNQAGRGKKGKWRDATPRSDESSGSRSQNRNWGVRQWRRRSMSVSSLESWSAGRYGSPGRVHVEMTCSPPPTSSSSSSIQPYYYPIRPLPKMVRPKITPDTRPPQPRHAVPMWKGRPVQLPLQRLSKPKPSHLTRLSHPQPGTSRPQGSNASLQRLHRQQGSGQQLANGRQSRTRVRVKRGRH